MYRFINTHIPHTTNTKFIIHIHTSPARLLRMFSPLFELRKHWYLWTVSGSALYLTKNIRAKYFQVNACITYTKRRVEHILIYTFLFWFKAQRGLVATVLLDQLWQAEILEYMTCVDPMHPLHIIHRFAHTGHSSRWFVIVKSKIGWKLIQG